MYLAIFLGDFFEGFKKRTEGRAMIYTSEYPFPGLVACLGQMNGMTFSYLLAVESHKEPG